MHNQNIDLEIAQARYKAEENRHKDIYAGEVWAGGEVMEFEERTLFDGALSIMLPTSFTELPLEIQRIKYPMERRPNLILSNPDTSVNVAFTLHQNAFTTDDMESALKGIAAGFYRMNPGTRFEDAQIIEQNGTAIGYFDFKGIGIDMDVYHIFAFMPFQGKMLQLIFNAPYSLVKSWKPVAVQIIKSAKENVI